MEKVKLTKKVLNEFIGWTTSRYNNYLGFGNKKDNVLTVFNSIKAGYFINSWYRKDKTQSLVGEKNTTTFKIECASPVGESGTNKRGSYWKTKQGGDEYTIDCINKTITAKYSKREIHFI